MSDTLSWTDQIFTLGQGFVGSQHAVNLKTGVQSQRIFRVTGTGQTLSVQPVDRLPAGLVDRLSRFSVPQVSGFSALALAAICDPEVQESFARLAEDLPQIAEAGLAGLAVAEGQLWVLDGDILHGDGRDQQLFHLSLIEDDAEWVPVPMAGLGLTSVRAITALASLAPWLYLAVCDPVAGFEVYRCDLGEVSGGFARVIDSGAQRFALNGAVSAVASTPAGLLVGTAALAHGPGPIGNWGPEVLLLNPAGTWDLIFGQPRFSPEGLRIPASGIGPGLGHAGNAAVKAMAQVQLDGRWITCLVLQDFSGKPAPDRAKTQYDPRDYAGGIAIYTSGDMDNWTQVAARLPDNCGSVSAVAIAQGGVMIGHEALGEDGFPATFIAL